MRKAASIRSVSVLRTLAGLAFSVAVATLIPAHALDLQPDLQVAQPRQNTPEASSGHQSREPVHGSGWMAVTANHHASEAAGAMLAAGGSAVDAAIAAQMVLTLVEPQSSGIGGGAFLLYFDAASRRIDAWDGRETAPSEADESLFLDATGHPVSFFAAVVGGRSVGVPGVVRMLEQAHRERGRLPWALLFQPAIALAREGFPVSPRLHALLSHETALRRDPQARALFYDSRGEPRSIGYRLRNPQLADTLARIARVGSLGLHAGPIAHEIVERVRKDPDNPGLLGEHDLAFYRPVKRQALCIDHGSHRVCGMPPPSSGGIAVGQILKLWRLGSVRLADGRGALDADGAHRFAEAGRLAFADRERNLADPDFVALPGGAQAFLSDRYLAGRALLIGARDMAAPAPPGTPIGDGQGEPDGARPASLEQPATTHLSIVDARGNAVSMTSSIESAFGARIMVAGFFLNNQLTDFSFAPVLDGRPGANRVQPGKRPRSSMSPMLVFDRASGALQLALGSPGGPSIINYVARSLIAILDDGIDPQAAVAMPNLGNRNGPTELELGMAPESLAQALRARGHDVRFVQMPSGLHGVAVDCPAHSRHHRSCVLTGAVDPRREGAVSTERLVGVSSWKDAGSAVASSKARATTQRTAFSKSNSATVP
jgi:gamma-glutamyltranspeptidase/glutathione hydrolase